LRVLDQKKRQHISALDGKFPTQANREFISLNRESLEANREANRQTAISANAHHLPRKYHM
jgi:hypothetical protein